jgi:hypothetical protein
VRKVLEKSRELVHSDLRDALLELPVVERGEVNPSKLGWFLRKNAGRIVDGREFQPCTADGRRAWRLVPALPPDFGPEPALPDPPPTDEGGEALDPTDLF